MIKIGTCMLKIIVIQTFHTFQTSEYTLNTILKCLFYEKRAPAIYTFH